jgi:membrane-associated protease RseP (regulator of RpoE activity)
VTSTFAVTLFVISLVVAILIHELGHLITAKWFGMRADRYFVGFGPTLWSTRRGETEYGVKGFPLGGFVSIRGMTPLDERRRPVADELFDRRKLSEDRARAAERTGAPGTVEQRTINGPDAVFETGGRGEWKRTWAANVFRSAVRAQERHQGRG